MTNEEAENYWLNHELVEDRQQSEAVWCAIEALKKQIPKKPIKKPYTDENLYYYEACPNCEEEVFRSESRKYCPFCGQLLDFGGINEF